MEPLAKWCKADYIEKRLERVIANENKLILADGQVVEYDILALNLGSRTRGTTGEHATLGVWEHSLTTRPINSLLPKIIEKEKDLQEKGIIPDVCVVGGGAAGVELSFAFKARWSKLFG
jgi:NADH dehydrogenase FAD-containing subunit